MLTLVSIYKAMQVGIRSLNENKSDPSAKTEQANQRSPNIQEVSDMVNEVKLKRGIVKSDGTLKPNQELNMRIELMESTS